MEEKHIYTTSRLKTIKQELETLKQRFEKFLHSKVPPKSQITVSKPQVVKEMSKSFVSRELEKKILTILLILAVATIMVMGIFLSS